MTEVIWIAFLSELFPNKNDVWLCPIIEPFTFELGGRHQKGEIKIHHIIERCANGYENKRNDLKSTEPTRVIDEFFKLRQLHIIT